MSLLSDNVGMNLLKESILILITQLLLSMCPQ